MWFIFTSPTVLATTLLAGLLSLFVHWYYAVAFSFWAKKGVHTVKPLPFFGNLKDWILLKKNFAHSTADIYHQTEGHKIVGFYWSSTPMLMIRDLELIKNVLLRDFQNFSDRRISLDEKKNPLAGHLFALGGSRWKKLRVKLTPTFTTGKMKMMTDLMRECCDEMVSCLQDSAAREESIDMKEAMAKCTVDVIGSCAFGLQMNTMKEPKSEFRAISKKIFSQTLYQTVFWAVGTLAPILLTLFPMRVTDDVVSEFFLRTVREIISYREENGVSRNDFIQLLINLRKNNSMVKGEVINHANPSQVTEKNHRSDDSLEMTDTFIAAQCFVFFVAGFETSSTTLSCCLYELARNMDVQVRLTEEVESVLRKHGTKLTYEAMQEMKYMDQVVDETLRIYPPAGVLARGCTRPYTIPGTSVHIDKETLVIIPLHGLHNDPKYFPDPERFDPDRFSEENAKNIPQFAYLPFGEGPRKCIGLRFGRMQVKACLAALLSRYQFFLCDKTSMPLKFEPKVFLVSTPTEVWLTIRNKPGAEVA